jgi:hypothetical protein
MVTMIILTVSQILEDRLCDECVALIFHRSFSRSSFHRQNIRFAILVLISFVLEIWTYPMYTALLEEHVAVFLSKLDDCSRRQTSTYLPLVLRKSLESFQSYSQTILLHFQNCDSRDRSHDPRFAIGWIASHYRMFNVAAYNVRSSIC